MHRRTFLQATSVALGGAATLGLTAFRTAVPAAVPRRLGVQLYTVRDLFPDDFVGVLEAIKRMGYDEVEFAGYHDRAPGAIRAVLDDLGLTAPSAHVGLDVLQRDLGAQLDAAHVMGHQYLTVPSLPSELRTSADGYRRAAAILNDLGARTKAAGVRLAYHNHDAEFAALGDRTGYDVLLAETDPALVAMELDLYWIVNGGRDPLATFAQHPGRFELVHVKDRTAGGAMADVGAGVLDWAAIFARAEQAGIKHAFVEHDSPAHPMASVRASAAYLTRLRGS